MACARLWHAKHGQPLLAQSAGCLLQPPPAISQALQRCLPAPPSPVQDVQLCRELLHVCLGGGMRNFALKHGHLHGSNAHNKESFLPGWCGTTASMLGS